MLFSYHSANSQLGIAEEPLLRFTQLTDILDVLLIVLLSSWPRSRFKILIEVFICFWSKATWKRGGKARPTQHTPSILTAVFISHGLLHRRGAFGPFQYPVVWVWGDRRLRNDDLPKDSFFLVIPDLATHVEDAIENEMRGARKAGCGVGFHEGSAIWIGLYSQRPQSPSAKATVTGAGE